MTRLIIIFLLLISVSGADQTGSDQGARCRPQRIEPGSAALRVKSGITFEGYKRAPIVTFEIDDSGTIRSARIKRSSGSRPADRFVLDEVRQWKFKPLPGCGTIESEAAVTIDFSSE